jgi:transcriptional regulator with XRE-family HTH domain
LNATAPAPEPDPVLGQVIRRLREERELDQAELADRSEVTEDMIERLEQGEVDVPWGEMRRIASALGLSMEEIASKVVELEGTGSSQP